MRWFLLLAAFLACPVFAQEPPEWFTESFLDLREDAAEAAKEGKRLMLYFHQEGCPYCKQLVTVNWRQPKIVEKTRRHFVPMALNIWGSREVTWTDGRRMSEKQFAAMLKVQFTPTLVFFDEKGAIAHRINGYLPPEEFYAALDGAIGKASAAASAPGGKAVDLRRTPGAKPVAVLLLSPGCDACDELERNLQLPPVRAQLARFELIRLSNPAPVTTAAGASTLRAIYVPSLIFLDGAGREVFRTEAYLRPFHLAGALEYVASGSYTREPSFQRFLQAKAERMRVRGERVDLWN
jgi:thioredoxin-related protein